MPPRINKPFLNYSETFASQRSPLPLPAAALGLLALMNVASTVLTLWPL
jgi:hypothetical protein